MNINSVWNTILPKIDTIVNKQKFSPNDYLAVHSNVMEYCTSKDLDGAGAIRKDVKDKERFSNIKGGQLYFKLKEYLETHCNNLLEQSADLMNEDLLQFYTTEWKKYERSAKVLHGCFSYLNRYWVKVEREMNSMIDRNEVALEIYNLAIVIWKNTFFNKYNTQLVNTAIKLLNRQREGHPAETTFIRQLTCSYTVMGICHDGKTPSLILYQNQFEKQFLEASEKFYDLKSADFSKEKSVMEYLKKVDHRLQEEANNISQNLDPSTQHILIKIVERSLIQKHLEEFLVEFRELLQLDKNDDLRLMYLLVNRNPEDMGGFIEEFQNFVHSEGLSRIERCGEAVKHDPKIYTNAILEVYKKYLNMISTVFKNNLEFRAALNKACTKFVNKNFATQEPNSVRKSSELICKFCDKLIKQSNSCHANELDQALDEILVLYQFIIDKDVFQQYYTHLFSKRLLISEYFDENSEKLMISKLKKDSGRSFTSQLEKMLRDVASSIEINRYFAKNNAEELKIDFNITILQSGSWPFKKSPEYTLPLELEKCVSLFSKYYFSNYMGKRLTWLYNLCKGEIVTTNFKNPYTFQCSNMQITILLLFNTSFAWSLIQLHEQTNIEMELIVQIVETLLKIKIVICEKPECLTPDSIISLNQFYNHKKHRINIRLPLKLENNQDQEALNINIERHRHELLQAKIVGIMKKHKTLNHPELIAKTLEAISSTFEPKVNQIKKSIEQVVQKEYVKRDSVRGIYTYIA